MERIKQLMGQIFRSELIPTIYTILLLLGISNYYATEYFWAYALFTVIAVPASIAFFKYVTNHRLAGFVIILILFFLYCSILPRLASLGYQYYFHEDHFDFGDYYFVWVLTPVGIMDFNPYYVLITYSLFFILISFASYYFTQVQYRIVVTFLLMLLPITVFGKDNEQLPLWILIPLLTSYFAVMIYARQLKNAMPKHTYKFKITVAKVEKPRWDAQIWKSVLCFLCVGFAAAMAVPKPAVRANRTMLEEALEMDTLTEFLMNAISDFTDSTDGGGSKTGPGSEKLVAYVAAEEPVILKTRTFTNYNFEKDTWNIGSYDQYTRTDDWQSDYRYRDINDLMDLIAETCKKNPDFQKEYHLDTFMQCAEEPVHTLYLDVQPKAKMHFLLSPTSFTTIDLLRDGAVPNCTLTGTVTEETYLGMHYGFAYQSPFSNPPERLAAFMNAMSDADWSGFLLSLVLEHDSEETDDWNTLFSYYKDASYAQYYAEEYAAAPSDRIQALAEQITSGCTTQIEKIDALLLYFENNGFVYDLDYAEPLDANAETFLFESKRGVCYEFATAMTLMCRSIGIPARYTEGYSCTDWDEQGEYLLVRNSDSHAFTEVYLNGFGWCTVDATIPGDSSLPSEFFSNHLTQFIGMMLLSVIFIVTVLYLLFAKRVSEAVFRYRVLHKFGDRAVSAILKRLRQQAELPCSMTVEELTAALADGYQADTAFLSVPFSDSVYGGLSPEQRVIEECYQTYQTARDKILQQKKIEKKQKWVQNKRNRGK